MKHVNKSYLCANGHHFSAPKPRCPYPNCTAEVRPTAMSPSTDGTKPSFKHLPKLPETELLAPLPASSPAPGPTPTGKHSIRWWAYVDRGRSRRTSSMRNLEFRWDATCSCGWDSDTGGDTMNNVEKLVKEHKP